MDPSHVGVDGDGGDGMVSGNTSESESERSGHESDLDRSSNDPNNESHDAIADEDDEDEDSDVETQRIGNSVLRFSRRCVKTGEFAKAMAALMNIIEISDFDSVPCRQALLFAAQVFVVTGQEAKALECVMEIWDKMPPPYTTQDAQLLLAVIHEHLEQPRFSSYWSKKAFGGSPSSLTVELTAWLGLAGRSYDEGAFILATESYSHAFACISQLQKWPSNLSTFEFVGRFLTALVSVAHLRRDRQLYRQQIAFSLAISLLDSNVLNRATLAERAFDSKYLFLRRVYASSFPTIYNYLFHDEDRFIARIVRAWRVFQACQARRQAVAERERQAQEAAAAVAAKPTIRAQKKSKSKRKVPVVAPPDAREDDQLRILRQRTKARIASLRRISPPPIKMNASPPKPRHVPPDTSIASPTRRKLETVKKLRPSTSEHILLEAKDEFIPSLPIDNQRPAIAESPRSSLLDVYTFPPLANRRRGFETDAGRLQGPADLDDELNEIEEFARLAHYRSRVLMQQHQPISASGQLNVAKVAPQWLRRYDAVLGFINAHEHDQRLPQAPVSTANTYFSEIHARVVFQLNDIHTKYLLQHGKTMFTIRLAKALRRLETWQFTRVTDDLLPLLYNIKRIGEEEETHRNLEFYHAMQRPV